MNLTLIILIIGLIAGFCEGASGAGWGVFTLAALVALDVNPLVAVSSSIFVELILGILNNIVHFELGCFDLKIALPLLITGAIGILVGSRFSARMPEQNLRLVIGSVVVLFGFTIIAKVLIK